MIERLRLIVVGAGGHGRAVAEAASLSAEWQEIVLVDDTYPQQQAAGRWPIVATIGNVVSLLADNDQVIVAIGNQAVRERLVSRLQSAGATLATVIHPRAWVSDDAVIGHGVAILAGAVVGMCASVGVGSIINANATVDHDVVLEDFVHLGVGVQLAGGVVVQNRAWLQAGVTAGYKVLVPANVVVAPGFALIAS